MPKIVDHDQRRASIVDGFLHVVARDGLEGATTRALAEELGMATGSLWHYFANSDALFIAAARRVLENTMRRILEASSDLRGLARLRVALGELLPLRADTREEAAIIVHFWGRLGTRSALAPATESTEAWWSGMREAIDEAIADGDLQESAPSEEVLLVLISVIYGQQVLQVADPTLTAERHLAVVEAVLQPWLAPSRHRPETSSL